MINNNEKIKRPELLSPAGSPEALEAAIEGGADAVYLGLSAFGARAYAKNFDDTAFREAASLAHAYGVKVYITLNTLIYDRERTDWLRLAHRAAEDGADAVITADIGAATLARKYIPQLPLHVSTQATGHNVEAARFFESLGFTRMVIARELPRDEIKTICRESPIEIEQFVHGALCVSVSGQCLMSSVIGGRSGNRGECAQPCRLPYGGKYPLSLKDLSLAEHIPEIIRSGVASLKIEGRMKAPEYVYGVTSLYRKLIDGDRSATQDEVRELADLFSRGGKFTDGYYTGKIGHAMLGVRGDDDKERSRGKSDFPGLTRKIDIDMTAVLKLGCPAALTVKGVDGRAVTVTGAECQMARTAPIDKETVLRSVSKLGNTPYRLRNGEVQLDSGVMLPVSALNALRRDGIEAFSTPERKEISPLPTKIEFSDTDSVKRKENVAVFASPGGIPQSAHSFFDMIFLPLLSYDGSVKGVIMPPVIFPGEWDTVEANLVRAKELGAEAVMIENPSQLERIKKYGFEIYGGTRLNVTSSDSAAFWLSSGVSAVSLSHEVKLPQARDIKGRTLVPVYGRSTLMLTEKCVLRELGGCSNGKCSGKGELRDRMGAKFPVVPLPPFPKNPTDHNHRSEIFNSLPTYMGDRGDELRRYGIEGKLFVFTVESKNETADIIEMYKNGSAAPFPVRRI